MHYRMLYPVKRWVTGQELIDGANDAIANNNLDNDPPTNAEEAMDILEELGDITMSTETREGPDERPKFVRYDPDWEEEE